MLKFIKDQIKRTKYATDCKKDISFFFMAIKVDEVEKIPVYHHNKVVGLMGIFSDEPSAIVIEGDKIYVNDGYMNLKDEKLKKAILYHEIGHLKLGHLKIAKNPIAKMFALMKMEKEADKYSQDKGYPMLETLNYLKHNFDYNHIAQRMLTKRIEALR